MQTFLPFACVDRSLRCLDHKRLHKQLTEAIQILQVIQAVKRGGEPRYRNHPAVLMWVGHEAFLRYYACRCSVVIKETTRRVSDGAPYDTTKRDQALRDELGGWLHVAPLDNAPVWFGKEEFHGPHRAALYRKRPDLYAEFQADSTRWDDYYWPVRRAAAETKATTKRMRRSESEASVPSKRTLATASHGVSKQALLRRTRSAPTPRVARTARVR